MIEYGDCRNITNSRSSQKRENTLMTRIRKETFMKKIKFVLHRCFFFLLLFLVNSSYKDYEGESWNYNLELHIHVDFSFPYFLPSGIFLS